MKVDEIIKSGGEETVTLSFVDSLQVVLWKEKYKIVKNQLRWYSFEPQSTLLPQVNFDPPLLFAPFSDESGELMRIISIETQTDTVKTENEITVDYQIQNIEDVKTQAGIFPDCIKMKLTFTYPQSVQRPLFVGEHYWWFAPGIGPVKYDLPTAFGELIEMNVSHLIL
ncbi:MAG: hypothetical protein EHM72_05205 [Calditrichaeota bacterium]|nr:MAG: hypothetical protein EHM72_05205 [Calditrichota bacterium]